MTELILSGGLLPAALVALWTAVMVAALQRQRLSAWWIELPSALLAGAIFGLLCLMLMALGPSGGPVGSAWLARIGASAAFGAFAFAWPLLALRRAVRGQRAGGRAMLALVATSTNAHELQHGHASGNRRT